MLQFAASLPAEISRARCGALVLVPCLVHRWKGWLLAVLSDLKTQTLGQSGVKLECCSHVQACVVQSLKLDVVVLSMEAISTEDRRQIPVTC